MEASQLEAYRANKDEFFATSHHSPLTHDLRPGFDGLRYYPRNPDLVFDVAVEPEDRRRIEAQTSDGALRIYETAGSVTFPIGGAEHHLTLYATDHDGDFVPFRDVTSGNETYAAGRYLDLKRKEDGSVTLDFNLAYNPFCAYDDAYSCPLPPVANWLSVPIEAGELDFQP